MIHSTRLHCGGRLALALVLLTALAAASRAQDLALAGGDEVATLADGRPIRGHLDASLRFVADATGRSIPLSELRRIESDRAVDDGTAAPAPFRLVLGGGQVLSGRLLGLDARVIRFLPAGAATPIAVARSGVRELRQRSGEVQILQDGFETLDEVRWRSRVGRPALAPEAPFEGRHSLRLAADGSALTTRLADPVGAGRFELAFQDAAAVDDQQRWFVDLAFRGRDGELASLRVVGGWAEETLAVESPSGPRLVIQPLIRKPGWHRLVVRFDADELDVAVDGDELAHGPGVVGPLAEIRLATHPTADLTSADLAVRFDDLSLVQFAASTAAGEFEPGLDEVRLISGDQLFGHLTAADPEGVSLDLDGQALRRPWAQVAGVRLRRQSEAAAPVAGPLVRVTWLAAGPQGVGPHPVDIIEGALLRADSEALAIDVPYAGLVLVPRDRFRRLDPLGQARRVVIAGHPYHLGDRYAAEFEPPQPDPGPLELAFELAEVPEGATALVLDVVDVIGPTGTPVFSELVQQGQLRTRVRLNDTPLPDLNSRISGRNQAPERIRLDLAPGTLRPGRNRLQFEQTGTPDDPGKRDNLGLLGIALESTIADPGAPRP